MQYEGQICRPPMERASYMLPVAVGCSYNACTFCTLFKHLTYRQLPKEQILAELQRVRQAGGDPKTVFLGDGNAFGLDTEHLLWILEAIHDHFPSCTAVNMDATVTNIREKSDAQLRLLRQAGVTRLYLGIESGLDDVLHFMRKDHNLAVATAQIRRLREAGLVYCAHIMTGIAGKGRGSENAAATAAFLNATQPDRLINFSIFHHRRAPLFRSIEAGTYIPSDEQENLHEERLLLQLLDVPGLRYDGFHDALTLRFRGTLPQDRESLLARVDEAIAYWDTQPPVLTYWP